MRHRVTANLILPKIPSGKILDVLFFEKSDFNSNSEPGMSITDDKKCELLYRCSDSTEMRSPYYMQVEIEIGDSSLVEELAREKFDHLINNISFLIDDFWGEYKIVKIDTWIKDRWVGIWSIFSCQTRLPISVNPSLLEEEELGELEYLSGIEDKIYTKSLYYLSHGEKRLNRDLVRGECTIDTETFLDLFKPIELISNEMCRNSQPVIPEEWKTDFDMGWTKDKETAIGGICKKFRKLRVEALPDKIEKTAEIFGFSDSVIKEVVRYNKMRSSMDVAHARKSCTTRMIDYAALSDVSRLFVRGYLKYAVPH